MVDVAATTSASTAAVGAHSTIAEVIDTVV